MMKLWYKAKARVDLGVDQKLDWISINGAGVVGSND